MLPQYAATGSLKNLGPPVPAAGIGGPELPRPQRVMSGISRAWAGAATEAGAAAEAFAVLAGISRGTSTWGAYPLAMPAPGDTRAGCCVPYPDAPI